MTESRHPIDSSPDAEADAALDHALRERPVDDSDDFDDDSHDGTQPASGDADAASTGEAPYVGDASGNTGEPPVTDTGDGLEDASDDGEDYVLYSEVRPHLEELVVLQEQRGKMVDLLLYARDRVSSPAVASRMDDNLGLLGIQVLVPAVGDRFDPALHEASATVPTDDPAVHGTIAEVELAGYTDGDRMVRPPIVTVYSADRESS